MKSFQKAMMINLGLLILSSTAEAKFITNYSVEGILNRSITHFLPRSVECSNQVMKSAEFSIRLQKTYGDYSKVILNKIKNANLDIKFWPSYPMSFKTVASTNMVGDIYLNNRKSDKTLSSLAATISHEGIHNLGFKHSDDVYPDVAYTVGSVVEELVSEGRCDLLGPSTSLGPREHTVSREVRNTNTSNEKKLKKLTRKVINIFKQSLN